MVLDVKAKYSAVTSHSAKLTQNKHADKHQIPDEIISTAFNEDGDDTSLMERLQNGKYLHGN